MNYLNCIDQILEHFPDTHIITLRILKEELFNIEHKLNHKLKFQPKRDFYIFYCFKCIECLAEIKINTIQNPAQVILKIETCENQIIKNIIT